MDSLTALQERIAHLERALEDISDIAARQSREIEVLQRRVQMLMEREADREIGAAAGPVPIDKPPHY